MACEDVTVIVEEQINNLTIEIQEDCEVITIEIKDAGVQGVAGKSAYEIAVENGYTGTEEEFAAMLLNNVPYEGATKDVDLGEHIITVDAIQLSTSPVNSVEVGGIVFNTADGTFDMKLLNDVTLQSGQEMHIFAKAQGVITNGDAVQFAGSQGDHLLVKKANATELNENPEYFIGVATHDFVNNQFGYTTVFGQVRDIDTTIYTDPILYFDSASATDGKMTDVRPTAGAKITVAAVVRFHQTQGALIVRPHVMPKIEHLQGVNISNLAENQYLIYNGTEWVSKWSWFQCASGFTSYEWVTDTAPLKQIHYTYSWGELWRQIDATSDNFYTDSGYTTIYQKKKL